MTVSDLSTFLRMLDHECPGYTENAAAYRRVLRELTALRATCLVGGGPASLKCFPPPTRRNAMFDLSTCPQTEEEAKAWFYDGIGRYEGGPAADYEQVLSSCGLPDGYGPGVVPNANMPYFAVTNMKGSEGSRGRIFLPTAVPDGNGYFTRQIQVIAGEAPLVWAWQWISGNEYTPVVGPGVPGHGTPSGGGTPPPAGLTVEEVQAMIDKSIAEATANKTGVQYGDKVALRTSGSDYFLGTNGEVKKEGKIEMAAKNEAHAWESFTLERGE